jgi:xylulokinase
LSNITGATIELYNTDGSIGAARGAGIGAGIYKDAEEAFCTLQKIITVTPEKENEGVSLEAYERWLKVLKL